ncbi:uncharacterized protein E0L32_011071 [Thyridium curvatum]|uniref:Riboflavin synthase n=1 Tax=Thyridium curvatum TaxID=1093900 RepID=A0A507AIJ9_9PEZI|nr:uncharacterized protein E0L32_011071 [Thyridium curvatum]TPX07003.1 hypothetical protein E0L32_011071 [Thyridium curvatum]
MFTGIVEEIGVVSELNKNDSTGGTSLTVTLPAGSQLLSDCHEGDSIAVNGVCLTVVTFSHSDASGGAPSRFTVGIAPETLRLTDLGDLRASSRVNLERAVRADTRMGGHFVQGHVDTTCVVTRREPDGNALTMRFRPRDRAVLRYVVKKGFIALDGTSLTVTAVDDDDDGGDEGGEGEGGWWEVMLISYTQGKVVLADKAVGDTVNVEVDVLAKYAEKSMSGIVGSLTGEGGLEQMIGKIVRQGLGGKP